MACLLSGRLRSNAYWCVTQQRGALEVSRLDTGAEMILQALHLPIHVQGKELFVTASVGASILPDDTDEIDGLLRNADVAMYRAKQQGRDTCQLFSAEMRVRAGLC